MTDATGQDQFTPVVNRRAGYSRELEWPLKIGRQGGTLAAGEGALLIQHFEERLATLTTARDAFAQSGWWAIEALRELMPVVRAAVDHRPLTEAELDMVIGMEARMQAIADMWATAVTATNPEVADAP